MLNKRKTCRRLLIYFVHISVPVWWFHKLKYQGVFKQKSDTNSFYLVNKSQVGAQFCLIYLFISLLYMFRAPMCPSSGENYCIYATLVFVTLYGWRLVCWLD